MTEMRLDLALARLLDALEAELLAAPDEEIQAIVAETGMKAEALLANPARMFRLMGVSSSKEEEVADVENTPSPARRERDAQA